MNHFFNETMSAQSSLYGNEQLVGNAALILVEITFYHSKLCTGLHFAS